MAKTLSNDQIKEYLSKGWIKTITSKGGSYVDGVYDEGGTSYGVTDAGTQNGVDSSVVRKTKYVKSIGSDADLQASYNKGVADTKKASATPSADAQIATAKADAAAAATKSAATVAAEQSTLDTKAATDLSSITSTVNGLLTQLATTSSPDYVSEYQKALDTQTATYNKALADMQSSWQTQQAESQANYDSQVGLLSQSIDQSKSQWETELATQKAAYDEQTGLLTKQYQDSQTAYEESKKAQEEALAKMEADLETERNRTGHFDSSISALDATGTEDDTVLADAKSELEKLKQVYAYDPAKQAELEAQYGGLLSEQQQGVQALYDEYGNLYNTGVSQFASGDYKLTELPSLYSKQSAYNQQLQSKQTSFFSKLADLKNTKSGISQRVTDDAAQLSSQRLAEKSSTQATLSQDATAKKQQSLTNQSATQNLSNVKRRGIVGTGLLSSYKL
jgi:hypothetical protein